MLCQYTGISLYFLPLNAGILPDPLPQNLHGRFLLFNTARFLFKKHDYDINRQEGYLKF